MARSRGGRGRKRSTKRNVDWVVNELCWDDTPYTLPNGAILGFPLTIPEFTAAYVDPTLAVTYGRHWWPEQDQGQVAYAVRGCMEVTPQTWAVGSIWRWKARIVKKPMEWGTNFNYIVDPGYDLYIDEFANERFLWETTRNDRFELGTLTEVVQVNWKGVQKLDVDEALFMFMQNNSGITQSLIIRPWLRTLMRANG